MKALGVFDKAYFISLERREDRRHELTLELERVGLCAEWYLGQEPKTSPPGADLRKHGCKMSHLGALKRGRDFNHESILIMEDDVIFHKDFATLWPKYQEILTYGKISWDVFTFGAIIQEEPLQTTNFLKLGAYALGHCYAVHRRIYDVAIREFEKPDIRNNDFIYRDLAREYNVFCPNPFLAWQRDGYSDLQRQTVLWSNREQFGLRTNEYLEGFFR
jgi:hypothetical protein